MTRPSQVNASPRDPTGYCTGGRNHATLGPGNTPEKQPRKALSRATHEELAMLRQGWRA